MGLIKNLKSKVLGEKAKAKESPSQKLEGIIAQISQLPGTQVSQGQIVKVEPKKVPSSLIIELLKIGKSLDEQNKHLQNYLQAMVDENENLQAKIKDLKETLAQTKTSLSALTD